MSRPSATIARIAGAIVLAGGVAVFAFNIHTMLGEPAVPSAGLPARSKAAIFLTATDDFLPLLGMGIALIGIAAIIDRKSDVPPFPVDALNRLHESLEEMRGSLTYIASNLSQSTTAAPPPPANLELPRDMTQSMQRIAALLEELRDASLMTDAQRQAKLDAQKRRQKVSSVNDATRLIQSREWAKADEAIAQLEADYPDDSAVAKCRQQLADGRGAAEGEAAGRVFAKVEDLMAVGSWDQALAMITQFAENYPNNEDGRRMLARVTRKRDLFRESTVHRLYEEIKEDTARRSWRKALSCAQRLLERFPDHPRADKIRGQLATIQANAEIEERQESEARIQELIRAKRFAEAIELAEDLLDRFPLSPQAESLEELLPKMRDLFQKQQFETSHA